MPTFAIVPRDRRAAAVAAWRSVLPAAPTILFGRALVSIPVPGRPPTGEITHYWQEGQLTAAERQALGAALPAGSRVVRVADIAAAAPEGTTPAPHEEHELPRRRPDMGRLYEYQQRMAWTPPTVPPPYEYVSLPNLEAIKRAGVYVPRDRCQRQVVATGNTGWVLVERWRHPVTGARYERRSAYTHAGPDTANSHDWREVTP